MTLTDILLDGLFGAVAAIGFGAISDPPARAFKYIALLGAVGHASRYFMMNFLEADIAASSFVAALIIGFGSLWLGAKIYCPTTVVYIPALLPMIPGKFAYNTVFAQIMFLRDMDVPELKSKYMEMFFSNGMVTLTVIFLLAIGATIPMFLFSKKANSLTRRKLSN
ncbi:MAG TPA: threonine/serine exporter family protein [Paludibacter sp.]|nr:threonine/serine exporter family protein [Paludibacter sp.]